MGAKTSQAASAVVLAAVCGFSSPALAVTYLKLEEAVKTYVPADAKVFKVTKHLAPEQRTRLRDDYGWDAKADDYVFYVGKKDDKPVAYVFVVPEVFNTCFHKYAVGLTAEGEVLGTSIVELSCPRAFPVNKKAFLGQFTGKRHTDALAIRSDIDAVTGATLSSAATASAVRKAVSLHNLFFGGAQPVRVSPEVAKARAAASAMIDKAIASGETVDKGGAEASPKPK